MLIVPPSFVVGEETWCFNVQTKRQRSSLYDLMVKGPGIASAKHKTKTKICLKKKKPLLEQCYTFVGYLRALLELGR